MNQTSSIPPVPGSAPGRLQFIDAVRSLAIALALYSHSTFVFGLIDAAPASAVSVSRLFTRAATPTFMLLFGVMLELVYARKLSEGRRPDVMRRLVQRSGQCYGGYLAIGLAGVLGGAIAVEHFLLGSVFLENLLNANALKFYTFAMLVAIPLLLLRMRFGLVAIGVVIAVIWSAYPLLAAIGPSPEHPLATLSSVLIGFPVEASTIHMLQGSTFICAGFFIGNAARRAGDPRFRAIFLRRCAVFVVAGLVVLVARFGLDVLRGTHESALEMARTIGRQLTVEFRITNDVGYYAWGLVQSCTLVALFLFIIPVGRRIPERLEWMLVFGRHPLMAFTAGNVLLNLAYAVPWLTAENSLPKSIALIAAYMLVMVGLLTLWRRRELANRAAAQAARSP